MVPHAGQGQLRPSRVAGLLWPRPIISAAIPIGLGCPAVGIWTGDRQLGLRYNLKRFVSLPPRNHAAGGDTSVRLADSLIGFAAGLSASRFTAEGSPRFAVQRNALSTEGFASDRL